MNHLIVMLLKLILLNLSCLTNCHPAPSMVLCHGLQTNVKYYYDYWTTMLLNNNDHKGKEPVSFGYQGSFIVENVWQDTSNYVIKVDFVDGAGNYLNRFGKKLRGPGYGSKSYRSYPMFAHIVDSDDKQVVKLFYRHNEESITSINLKKSIAALLRTKRSDNNPRVTWSKKGQDIEQSYSSDGDEIKPVMSPLVIDEWAISTRLGRDHTYVVESSGWQNVSLISRLYSNAYSKLHLRFTLKLKREEKSTKSKLSEETDINKIFESLGGDYIEDQLFYQREHQTCHNCKTLVALEKEYEEHMRAEEMASIPAAIAYLKLMDRVRSGGPGTSREDIIQLLKERKSKSDTLSSLLDIIAGSRTDQSVGGALQFLNLPENEDLDVCERFLASLSASCLTAAQSSSDISISSLQFIISELLEVAHVPNWRSSKLKWATIMALGTALRAYNSIMDDSYSDTLNGNAIKRIITELNGCDDIDCRVTLLHALGSTGNLKLSLDIFAEYAVNSKAKRESVAALKSIQECISHLSEKCQEKIASKESSSTLQSTSCTTSLLDKDERRKLHTILSQVIWDEKQETTSRIVATEIATLYLRDNILVNSIMKDVENFDNFEMTTLMWNRALKAQKPSAISRAAYYNWFVHSNMFNGSSAYFQKIMGGTNTMNASYGITMELLNKARLLKESSFQFELQAKNSKPQHILSVGLLARGIGSVAGDDSSDEDEEATSAGLLLKVLNVQLRPYTLFSGKGELMGHVWSGTASDPMTAFAGNLLISDHHAGHHLINGFVLEEQMRGVLSLELTGEIQISLWNRNSHSVVQAKGALLIQGSQTILTSDIATMISQRFAFGGSTSMDLVTDAEFYKMPFKHCLQMHQPELIVRHNTRKYEQVDSDKVDARIHRRHYYIPAKSFAFHQDNNEMCALMKS